MNNVTTSLENLFKKHRIVFWYDPEGEMQSEYEELSLAGIEKIQVENNEFGVKHRVMREEREQKFLIYSPKARPNHKENWFLDLELAYALFYADKTSLTLQEMGWQEEQREFLEAYAGFFGSKARKEKLLSLLHPEDGRPEWRLKMVSVICGTSPTLEMCLLALIEEQVKEKEEKMKQMGTYGLEGFFWEQIQRQYDYASDTPTLLDFIIEIFINAAPLGREPKLGKEAKLFLGRWKDSSKYKEGFEALSAELESSLSIVDALHKVEGYESLLELDTFEPIEKKIISEVRDEIMEGTCTAQTMKHILDQRGQSYWFSKYETIYQALYAGVKMIEEIKMMDVSIEDFQDGIDKYTQTYWKVDQLYRHFYFYYRSSGQSTLLNPIRDEIERRYTNEFLLTLGDAFQGCVDDLEQWKPARNQRTFFHNYVSPTLKKDRKLYVIISDALRYEVAEELNRRILKEDRFRSELSHQVTGLPSYTQLGMSALLPHDELEVDPTNSHVKADGQRTTGSEAREKVLNSRGHKAVVIKGSEFLELKREDGRALYNQNEVIYIYQNKIDQVGDKRETENEVFNACEEEIETLVKLVRKVYSINGYNILITADHGFLFQYDVAEESDFTETPEATNLGTLNRRFAFAETFQDSSGSKVFTAQQLGLQGDYEVAIPKSINRYRQRGAGARYVHGGASLQEIVVPVINVNITRKADVEKVEVDVIRSGSNLITTAQIKISFYQTVPAKAKQLARELKVGFYTLDGTLLSNEVELSFDSPEENERNRERKVEFTFSKLADSAEYRNAEVILKLEEKIPRTNKYSSYKDFTYRLKKTFETDFDFI